MRDVARDVHASVPSDPHLRYRNRSAKDDTDFLSRRDRPGKRDKCRQEEIDIRPAA